MSKVRYLIFLICICIGIHFFRIQLKQSDTLIHFVKSPINNIYWNTSSELNKQKDLTPTRSLISNLKYILLWNINSFQTLKLKFEEGDSNFVNCEFKNYFTYDKSFFKNGVGQFDAIVFHGRRISDKNLPMSRSPHQKYIYFFRESSNNYPVCDEFFDGYFNWTATYRLDSDIPVPYIGVKNKQGQIIGPKINMTWPESFKNVDDNMVFTRFMRKFKAAAWLVSHCLTRNHRENFVKELHKALQVYGLFVDVYGKCGPLKCPRDLPKCDFLLESNYFFYLSLENSFSEDYVTEKLLTALEHYMVPVVFGGADYSRFLPPGSYINAREFDVNTLAATMYNITMNLDLYRSYFRWRTQCTYFNPAENENFCALCAAMNDELKVRNMSIYKQFRKWWNNDYEKKCNT